MKFKIILTVTLLIGVCVPYTMARTANSPATQTEIHQNQSEPEKMLNHFLNAVYGNKKNTKSGNQAIYVGSEYCIACHPTKAGWRETRHALDVREPLIDNSLISGKGIVADFDRNGTDDFIQGLNFNLISSAFDAYKPNAPILSIENGNYFITIGQIKMKVIATIGGTGKWGQVFVVRIPVTGTSDGYSEDNYISPLLYNEKTARYETYHPEAWYDTENQPKFNNNVTGAQLAAENSSSFSKNCSQCHSLATRNLQQADTGEWLFSPYLASLFPPNDPSYMDFDHNGLKDLMNNGCEGCHGPGSLHILGHGDIDQITNPADLDTGQAIADCSKCHASDTFTDTNHPLLNAIIAASKHNDTQSDVADELGEERAGETPDEVINGDDPENCIACHGPTAVLANGGMSEVDALNYFFTTTDGRFTEDTTIAHSDQWPNVSCIACHDQHNPGKPAYFNSSTGEHQVMENNSQLCGQCHGNLRFPDTDHLSYNIETGTGAVGVADIRTMPGVECTDCHMYASDTDGSRSGTFHGHGWEVSIREEDGSDSVSCSQCHDDITTESALQAVISTWRTEFQTLDATTAANVEAAATAMEGVNDASLQAKLEEAQHNLDFAESDESTGFHNHNYLMALLNDANTRALEILNTLGN